MGKILTFTLDETELYHRLMWGELAATGCSLKTYLNFWGEQKINPQKIDCMCFPCQFAYNINRNAPHGAEDYCDKCPVAWPGGCCCAEDSPYKRWLNAGSREGRKACAAEVRDIAFKHGAASEGVPHE